MGQNIQKNDQMNQNPVVVVVVGTEAMGSGSVDLAKSNVTSPSTTVESVVRR